MLKSSNSLSQLIGVGIITLDVQPLIHHANSSKELAYVPIIVAHLDNINNSIKASVVNCISSWCPDSANLGSLKICLS